MTTLHHGGFDGEFVSDEPESFVKITGIWDTITARVDPGQDAAEVFRDLVEEYVETRKTLPPPRPRP